MRLCACFAVCGCLRVPSCACVVESAFVCLFVPCLCASVWQSLCAYARLFASEGHCEPVGACVDLSVPVFAYVLVCAPVPVVLFASVGVCLIDCACV